MSETRNFDDLAPLLRGCVIRGIRLSQPADVEAGDEDGFTRHVILEVEHPGGRFSKVAIGMTYDWWDRQCGDDECRDPNAGINIELWLGREPKPGEDECLADVDVLAWGKMGVHRRKHLKP